MVDDVLRENREQVREHPMSESWLRERSRTACEFEGVQEGSQAFSECRARKIENFLETPISSPMSSTAMSVAASVRGLADRR